MVFYLKRHIEPILKPQAKQLARSKGGATAAGGKQPAPGVSAEETGGAYYRKYILQDLAPWAEHGITEVCIPHTLHRLSSVMLRKLGWLFSVSRFRKAVYGGIWRHAGKYASHLKCWIRTIMPKH